MKKEFNVTGNCYPENHYMMDNSKKLEYVYSLVEGGKYFAINRPRQYGKTTTLECINEQLSNTQGYLPIEMSFQGVDNQWYVSDKTFAIRFFQHLSDFFEYENQEVYNFLMERAPEISDMDSLSKLITKLIQRLNTKVVLLIDEVDASSNYLPFLNFLSMLRAKYLGRKKKRHATFHSIILAGVHDVKSLKYKLRNPEDAKYNSPWNIAADFKKDMAFNPQEIAPMLEEYGRLEGVKMDISTIAERLYYHTSGYPFLVSKLCRILVEEVLPQKTHQKIWTLEDVEKSVQLLLKENNTNFESLIKNLENNEELYDVIRSILIEGTIISFNPDAPILQLGRTYGIFKENGRLKIHNRIYEQRIYNYMATKTLIQFLRTEKERFGGITYTNKDHTLNLEKVLRKFQAFIKLQRSKKDATFIERQWRLIFLAFLQPIINGKGYDFKEVEISEEKRLDVVVTYYQHKYILELKLWRGAKKHKEGLDQLANYLDKHQIKKGYLIIFDNRKKPLQEVKWISHKGKEVFAVWV